MCSISIEDAVYDVTKYGLYCEEWSCKGLKSHTSYVSILLIWQKFCDFKSIKIKVKLCCNTFAPQKVSDRKCRKDKIACGVDRWFGEGLTDSEIYITL